MGINFSLLAHLTEYHHQKEYFVTVVLPIEQNNIIHLLGIYVSCHSTPLKRPSFDT